MMRLSNAMLVILGASIMASDSLGTSMVGPFFPTLAGELGLSPTLIGLISSTTDVAIVITSLSASLIFPPKRIKQIFFLAPIVSGTCNALFGFSHLVFRDKTLFTISCFVFRFGYGFGTAMIWASGFSLLSSLTKPHLSGGRISSALEIGFGVGFIFGHSVGSTVFRIGGYPAPFLVATFTQFALSIIGLIICPDPQMNAAPENTKFSDIVFLFRPSFLIVGATLALGCSIFGILGVALSPHLLEKFGIQGDTVSYYFMSNTLAYVAFNVLTGHPIDKGHGGIIFIFGSFLCSCFSLLMFADRCIPPNALGKVYMVILLGLLGCAESMVILPGYILSEKLCLSAGKSDLITVKMFVGRFIAIYYGLGTVIGPPVFGGLILERVGFHKSWLVLGCCLLGASVVCTAFLLKRKLQLPIFYEGEIVECPRHNPETDL